MDFAFCPELDELIRSRRVVGRTGKVFESLGALSTPNNLHVLRALMLEQKPARTLEVGLSFGGSALTIAASHRELGHQADRQHVAIDPFQHSVWDDSGLQNVEHAGLIGFIDFRPQLSAIALADLLGQGKNFDLIYIDGSHRFDDVFVDAYFAFRLLRKDGIVLFDDCSTDDVATVPEFRKQQLGNIGPGTRPVSIPPGWKLVAVSRGSIDAQAATARVSPNRRRACVGRAVATLLTFELILRPE